MKRQGSVSAKTTVLDLRPWNWSKPGATIQRTHTANPISPFRLYSLIGESFSSRSEIVILISILIFGAFLRAIALQNVLFEDERVIFYDVLNFFKNHTLLPKHFNYPTFFSYLVAIPTAINSVALWITEKIPEVNDTGALFLVDPLKVFMPARIVSIVFGLLTITTVYVIGKRFFNHIAGIVAAAFIAISSIHIVYSSWALPDVTMTFFATLTLLFSLQAMYSKSTKHFILGGFFAGLATATKYNGGMVLAPLIFSLIISLRDEGRPLLSFRNLFERRLLLTGLVTIMAFIFGSIGLLIDPTSYIKAFLYDVNHMKLGHLGAFGPLYFQHIKLFWHAETTIALLFGVGLIYAIIRRKREDILLLVFIFSSYAIIGSWQTKRLHYLLFIYPALALLGGSFISQLFNSFSNHANLRTIPIILIVLPIFGWPLYSHLAEIPKQLKTDNRIIAERWIQNNIQSGSSVIVEYPAYIPKLYSHDELIKYLTGQHKIIFEEYLNGMRTYDLISIEKDLKHDTIALEKSTAEYLVTSSYCYARFFTTQPPPDGNPLFQEFQKRKRFYEFLFQEDESSSPWGLMKEFKSGNGPVIRIYRRRAILSFQPSGEIPKVQPRA